MSDDQYNRRQIVYGTILTTIGLGTLAKEHLETDTNTERPITAETTESHGTLNNDDEIEEILEPEEYRQCSQEQKQKLETGQEYNLETNQETYNIELTNINYENQKAILKVNNETTILDQETSYIIGDYEAELTLENINDEQAELKTTKYCQK